MAKKKKWPSARILGIETSCDETAIAIVQDGRLALSNIVASQAALHAQYGGIFPEVASREHIKVIDAVLEQALQAAHLTLANIDAIAVTRGPGLPGSLVVGLNLAKGLSLSSSKKLYAINHLEGHIYSAWVKLDGEKENTTPPKFPLLALIVSGGHTELVLMRDHLKYQRLGGTLDDAAGEAFDKIARLLELGYPGGPAIQESAQDGDPQAFKFPRAWLPDTWDFSFSGLKTAVLHQVRELKGASGNKELPIADLAASFQAAVVEVLVGKTLAAAEEHEVKSILVAGGVSANQSLREEMQAAFPETPVHLPPLPLTTDNAAMIAAAGYYRLALSKPDPLDIDALPSWLLA